MYKALGAAFDRVFLDGAEEDKPAEEADEAEEGIPGEDEEADGSIWRRSKADSVSRSCCFKVSCSAVSRRNLSCNAPFSCVSRVSRALSPSFSSVSRVNFS